MSIIQGFWVARGAKLYLGIVLVLTLFAFFAGYFVAKNETVPIVIQTTGEK